MSNATVWKKINVDFFSDRYKISTKGELKSQWTKTEIPKTEIQRQRYKNFINNRRNIHDIKFESCASEAFFTESVEN